MVSLTKLHKGTASQCGSDQAYGKCGFTCGLWDFGEDYGRRRPLVNLASDCVVLDEAGFMLVEVFTDTID